MSASVSQYADLVGKRILITGASSGIGAGMAGVLAQQGCHLVLHYHHNQTGIAKTLETVLALGAKAEILQCDFRQLESVHKNQAKVIDFLSGGDDISEDNENKIV
ncbi:MAG: hypothetical protein COT01_06665 [Piscirickettsiaceae bacterium CG07_land_8_20_14_0_80_44_28]|nr:MAG: hypothetical protein COT01_06665 [Piscirickettsiaceae bacterium CG07_land_8_20_14_0_80_44_28]